MLKQQSATTLHANDDDDNFHDSPNVAAAGDRRLSSAAAGVRGNDIPYSQQQHHKHSSASTCFPSFAVTQSSPATANKVLPQTTENDDANDIEQQQSATANVATRAMGRRSTKPRSNSNSNNRKQRQTQATDCADFLASPLPCSSTSSATNLQRHSTTTNRRPIPLTVAAASGTNSDHTNNNNNRLAASAHTHPPNIIVIPPVDQRIVGEQQQQQQQQQLPNSPPQRRTAGGSGGGGTKRHSTAAHSTISGSSNKNDEGMLVLVQQKLFEHYHTVAYILIIISYFAAFCEYLYLRLISLIFPKSIPYQRQCEKHYGEPVYRNELHFASGLAIFLVMSIYQLVCFYLLTVSSKYLQVKRTFSNVISIEERLHHELMFAVKRTMFTTLYPTFGIYLLTSSTIICTIYYMVGLRDAITHIGSYVIVYMFDVFVIMYFLAFPILCVLFHPDINCRSRLPRLYCVKKAPAAAAQNSQSLQTTSNDDGSSPETAKIEDEGRQRKRDIEHHQNASRSGPIAANPAGGPQRRHGGGGTRGAVHPAPEATTTTIAKTMMMAPTTTAMGGDGGGRRRSSVGGTAANNNINNANYGSLERRQPTTMVVDAKTPTHENAATAGNSSNGLNGNGNNSRTDVIAAQTDSVRLRMRQRRQSRYKRLRGGSDESAECRMQMENGKEGAIRTGGASEAANDGGETTIVARLEANIRRNEQMQADQQQLDIADIGMVEQQQNALKKRQRAGHREEEMDGNVDGKEEMDRTRKRTALQHQHGDDGAESIQFRGYGGAQQANQAGVPKQHQQRAFNSREDSAFDSSVSC